MTEGVLIWNGRVAGLAPAAPATAGNADLHARALAGSGRDAHRSAGSLDADALRGKADVTLCEPVGEVIGRKAATVVLDDERELSVGGE